jgi:hypothetical protein
MKKNPQQSLLISSEGENLSPAQLAFNELVQKLEEARKKLAVEEARMEEKLLYTMKVLYPMLADHHRRLLGIVEECFDYYTSFRMPAGWKNYLPEIILSHIQGILMGPRLLNEKESRRLIEISNAITGNDQTPQKNEEESDFEEMRRHIEEDFKNAGIEIDLSGLNAEMSEAEVLEYIRQQRRLSDDGIPEPRPRKKSKKQLAREAQQKELEDLKQRGLKTIYKELAKILHPDLESDSVIRQQKEEWMKKLTAAYDARDLKTLLEIELEWIKGEKERIAKTSEEKLNLYNLMLKEQLRDLRESIETVGLNPRYQPIHIFANTAGTIKRWRPEQKEMELAAAKVRNEKILQILRQKDKASKQLISQWVKARKEEDKYGGQYW